MENINIESAMNELTKSLDLSGIISSMEEIKEAYREDQEEGEEVVPELIGDETKE
jgi:hypothetical protein